uniref:Peptidase C2 calpain domain-containing protein n=1 Tax=Timema bartmani TaxID=61472 RepID=A0A7R9ETZ3_9NEOP|nr:unnamed protein product [Timema bartmani]
MCAYRMSFEDFARHFTHLDLVHIGPDDWMLEPALHSKQPWRAVLARRRWRSGYNAGGGPGYTDTTATNPQFHIQIPRASSNKCHVVVSVTQYYETHPVETKKKKALYAIGFAVYEIPHSMARVTPHFVTDQKPLDVTNHSVAREVVTFFTLPPGDYIVLPQTNVPNCDGKFLLRILTDEQSNIWEVNEDNMVFRNITSEFLEEAPLLIKTNDPHTSYLSDKPSLELCKSLIMLRDYNISGRINLMDIPVLMHMLHFWRIAFQKFDRVGHGTKTSSYNLRALLWEAGSTASNKVLECLVLRFSKSKILTSECFVMAMVRLHLAHDDPNDHLLLTILMAALSHESVRFRWYAVSPKSLGDLAGWTNWLRYLMPPLGRLVQLLVASYDFPGSYRTVSVVRCMLTLAVSAACWRGSVFLGTGWGCCSPVVTFLVDGVSMLPYWDSSDRVSSSSLSSVTSMSEPCTDVPGYDHHTFINCSTSMTEAQAWQFQRTSNLLTSTSKKDQRVLGRSLATTQDTTTTPLADFLGNSFPFFITWLSSKKETLLQHLEKKTLTMTFRAWESPPQRRGKPIE